MRSVQRCDRSAGVEERLRQAVDAVGALVVIDG